MAAGRLDLTIEKGSTFERVFTWRTKNPTTNQLEDVNLTGYGARAMVKETYEDLVPLIDLATSGIGLEILDPPTSGKIKLSIPATVSSAVFASYGVWDLEVFNGDYVTRLLEGRVTFREEVTK